MFVCNLVKKEYRVFDIASLRLIKFTFVTQPPQNFQYIRQPKKGRSQERSVFGIASSRPIKHPRQHVRADQTSTTFLTRQKYVTPAMDAVHKFGVLSSNIRLFYHFGHRSGETEARVSLERREDSYVRCTQREETFRYNFDLQTFHAFPR